MSFFKLLVRFFRFVCITFCRFDASVIVGLFASFFVYLGVQGFASFFVFTFCRFDASVFVGLFGCAFVGSFALVFVYLGEPGFLSYFVITFCRFVASIYIRDRLNNLFNSRFSKNHYFVQTFFATSGGGQGGR